MPSVDDDLTIFRTNWLRAIAMAWADPTDAFKNDLIRDPQGTLTTTFSFAWPWPNSVTLQVVEKPQDFLWVGDSWTWPHRQEQDKLTLVVPLQARNIVAADHALALADYYAAYPSLFGGRSSAIEKAGFRAETTSLHPEFTSALKATGASAAFAATFASTSAPVDGFYPTQGSFFNFQVALLSVMAKAWENDNFRTLITKVPVAALNSIRDYKLPWAITLEIRDDTVATWDKAKKAWLNAQPNILQLCLPTRPPTSRDQTIAIAAYNSTGAEFPFTCCA
ncbi:MAG: BMA_0021/BMA_0022 family TOMM bacteriocin [Polyangiaceae bacterium]